MLTRNRDHAQHEPFPAERWSCLQRATTVWNGKIETRIEHLKTTKPKGFTPGPCYSVEGDSLTFYFKDDESYRERVDDFLTA